MEAVRTGMETVTILEPTTKGSSGKKSMIYVTFEINPLTATATQKTVKHKSL